jgi:hypothetical protein
MGLLKNQAVPSGKPIKRAKVQSVARRLVSKPFPKGTRSRFGHWFNHRWEAIAKEDGQNWKTFNHPLSLDNIWELWNDPTTAIGLRFGKTTRYGMFDIDAPGKYHNEEGLKAVKDALAILGIEDSLLVQSSSSGGWHLYFFLPQAISTFALACGLQDAIEMVGLELKKGHLEAFPNRKGRTKDGFTLYNGHRLPLQKGSALLDNDGVPYSQSIEVFLAQAEMAATRVDFDLLLSTCQDSHSRYTARLFDSKAKHQPLARQFGGKRLLKELNNIIDPGWTAHGQSNDILGAIAAKGRIFQGLGGQALADYVYQTAIDAPGFGQYCRHQRECPAWAVRWARCAERKYYPYGTRKGGDFKALKEAGPTNEERQADAKKRIVEAIADYETSGRCWPSTIRARRKLIASMACCSERTLAKAEYLMLWHPAHISLANSQKPDTVGDAATQSERDPAPPITVGPGYSAFEFKKTSSTSACTSPRRAKKTKTVQNLTGQGIQKIIRFEAGETVPISRRLAIVNNRQNHTQQGTQPLLRIVNRPKLPIADPNPNGVKPGDWVVELHRPRALLRLESIDPDGEYCRCQDVHWGGRELCLLSELNHAPPDLVAEYLPNGDRHQTFTQPLTNHG